ncbi:glycosyltransferase family 4 protein [Methanomethylovorans sp.]|uniref:glycosyltransferase family 4 protein n=1 Tax=Methanomethylovorans sp. TaxID=2758717 RepID=UPI00351C8E61
MDKKPAVGVFLDLNEKKALFLLQSYNNFQKESVNSTCGYFKECSALVRSNPISEIHKYVRIPFLAFLDNFKLDYKIDLTNIPSNLRVYPTPILYAPINSQYKKLGQKHFDVADKAIKEHKIEFDLVHSHFTWSSGHAGAKLKEKYGVPFVVTGHGYDIYEQPFKSDEWKEKIEYVLNSADAIITVSHSNLACIRKLDVKTPVHVLPNGYRSDQFYQMDMEKCRSTLGLPLDKKIIVAVGNLLKIKGHRYLIEAMAEVVRHRTDVVCFIVGGGALEKELKEQIRATGLQDYVKLTGSKPHGEIPLWMNACDIFVLPSLNEGNPTVMFECLGCGKPFVGTRVGGVPEIIVSEDYGLLTDPENPAGLAEKILSALDKKWDKAKIKEYSSQFTWAEIAKNIAEIYKGLF